MARRKLNWDAADRRTSDDTMRRYDRPGKWTPPNVWKKRAARLRTSSTGKVLRRAK